MLTAEASEWTMLLLERGLASEEAKAARVGDVETEEREAREVDEEDMEEAKEPPPLLLAKIKAPFLGADQARKFHLINQVFFFLQSIQLIESEFFNVHPTLELNPI
jgi:hypothetical protein